jgi:mRNA-degrading endonuclease RelE of RelBE toxin-antitoxin system
MMGADITWKGKDGKEFYFRDSYNASNLAWIIGLSYWKSPATLRGRKDFFKQMARITDKQIVEYVKKLHENPEQSHIKPDVAGWKRMFKGKRDEIVVNLKLIVGAKSVVWSV